MPVLVQYRKGTHVYRKPFREFSDPVFNPLLGARGLLTSQKCPPNSA